MIRLGCYSITNGEFVAATVIMKTKKTRQYLFFLLLLVILFFGSGLVLFLINSDKNQNNLLKVGEFKDYQSFVLSLDNPSVTNGAEVITTAVMKVAQDCNCLEAGYPKIEYADGEHFLPIASRIYFDDSKCGFVTIPGAPSAVAPSVYINLLPTGVKGLTAKIEQGETKGFYIRYGSMGKFCGNYFDQKDPSYAQTQEIILTALKSIGARGYEKFDY